MLPAAIVVMTSHFTDFLAAFRVSGREHHAGRQ